MEQIEQWKPIAVVVGYEVSNLGRVRHTAKQSIKGSPANRAGYLVVNLWHRNKGTVCYVHDLVCAAFIGPKLPRMSVNHIDGDKSNNTPSNLEYISLTENTLHQHRTGLARVKGEANGQSKLTTDQVLEIKYRALLGERTKDLAHEFGVKAPIVSQIKHGSRWAHLDHLE